MEYKNRELIQVLTLAEVCREVGSSLIFQGGTAIRVFFGGARTSEDLDFYVDVRALTKVDKAADKISIALARVLDYVDGVTLDSHKVRQRHHLHTMWFIFNQVDTRKRLRLKVDFFQVTHHFQKIETHAHLLITAPLVRRNISAFNLFLDRLNMVVQVETTKGILADKVVAILARPYVKGRDFWDIWFLREVLGLSLSKDEIELRKEIYGIRSWKRSLAIGVEGWPSRKELIELLDRDLKRFLDQEELESLRKEAYEKILKPVEDTLIELL